MKNLATLSTLRRRTLTPTLTWHQHSFDQIRHRVPLQVP